MDIRDHAARNPVQPEPLSAAERDLVEASPGHQEGLRDDIGGVLGILDSSQRVRKNRPCLLAVKPAEAHLGELFAERCLFLDPARSHLSI